MIKQPPKNEGNVGAFMQTLPCPTMFPTTWEIFARVWVENIHVVTTRGFPAPQRQGG